MIRVLARLLSDRGVRYYFLHKAAVVLSVPVTATLVLTALTKAEQGFFFTMLSLMAFQSIVELGFNTGLVHFTSHEASEVRFGGGRTEGPARARSRLGSLVLLAAAWTGAAALLLVPSLGAGGYAFLSASGDASHVEWRTAWWLLCLGLPLGMYAATLRSLAEGCGDVGGSQKSLLWSALAGNAAIWLALMAGTGLYAVAAGQIAGGAVALALIVPRVLPQLALVRERASGMVVDWRREFLPHQWRLAVSWLAGLAMFQTFVPFVFHARGAEEAGQAGILMQAFTLANLLGLAWVTAGQASLGRAWARRDFTELRALGRQIKRRALWTASLAGALAMAGVAALHSIAPALAQRIGPLSALALLMACAVVLQSANVDTAVIRFGKTEPFLRNSIAGALAVCASNWFLAPFGLPWLFAGFTVLMAVLVVPWVRAICVAQLARQPGATPVS